MEIDAPAHAVAIWIEGDAIMVRYPNGHHVAVEHLNQLMSILRGRAIDEKKKWTVGTRAAPVQYDIDIIASELRANGEPRAIDYQSKDWDARVKEAGERQRTKDEAKKKRLLNKDAKRMAMKEAEQLLSEIGL